MTTQMYSPDDIETRVLKALATEHRANPLRIREQTDIRKQYVNNALSQLAKADYVNKVTTGLYEITENGREKIGVEASETEQNLRECCEELEQARDRIQTLETESTDESTLIVEPELIDDLGIMLDGIERSLDGPQPDVQSAHDKLIDARETVTRLREEVTDESNQG